MCLKAKMTANTFKIPLFSFAGAGGKLCGKASACPVFLSSQLKALERDGSALKNHQVYLVINVNNMQTNQTLTTDSDGVATFSLDTAAWDEKGVSLEVRLSGHNVGGKKPRHGFSEHGLDYSKSLKMFPPDFLYLFLNQNHCSF